VEARAPWPPAPSDRGPRTSDAGSAISGLRVVTKRQPTPQEWTALRFAWRVCAHVKSNTIVFTAADRTLAVGAGQMSRVDAVKVAVMKASPGLLRGSVVASDAFFRSATVSTPSPTQGRRPWCSREDRSRTLK